MESRAAEEGEEPSQHLQGVQPLYRSVVPPPCPTRGAAILQSVRAGWGRGYRTVVPTPSRRSSGGRGQGREGAAQRRIIAAALLGPNYRTSRKTRGRTRRER